MREIVRETLGRAWELDLLKTNWRSLCEQGMDSPGACARAVVTGARSPSTKLEVMRAKGFSLQKKNRKIRHTGPGLHMMIDVARGKTTSGLRPYFEREDLRKNRTKIEVVLQ